MRILTLLAITATAAYIAAHIYAAELQTYLHTHSQDQLKTTATIAAVILLLCIAEASKKPAKKKKDD